MGRHLHRSNPTLATLRFKSPVVEGKNFRVEVTSNGQPVAWISVRYHPRRQVPGHYPGVLYVHDIEAEGRAVHGSGVAEKLHQMAREHARTVGLPLTSDVILSDKMASLWKRWVQEGKAREIEMQGQTAYVMR